MPRKSFSIHSDFYNELSCLPDDKRGELLLALICWANDEETPELDSMSAMLFRLMTAQIERISSTNSSNGTKGGRGNKSVKSEKSEKSDESEAKRKKPSVTVSVTDSLKDLKDDAPQKSKPIPKHTYGEFQNVLLQDDEHAKLAEALGDKAASDYIERLSAYIASSGKRYKSHYATILNWYRKDCKESETDDRASHMETGYNDLAEYVRMRDAYG